MASKKKSKKTKLMILGIASATVILGLAGAEMFRYLGPNMTYTDIRAYLQLKGEDEWAFVCNTSRMKNAIESGGDIYLPLSSLYEFVDSAFYYDTSEDALICVLPSGKKMVAGSELILKENERYVNADFLIDNYACDIVKSDESKTVWLWTDYKKEYSVANLVEQTQMRVDANVRSEIVKDIADKKVFCLETSGKFTKCLDDQGSIGYVKTDALASLGNEKREYKGAVKQEYDLLRDGSKVIMGWHMMDEYNYGDQVSTAEGFLVNEPGLNVISPTWYSVKNALGEMTDFSSIEYVNMAHSKNIKVWGLVDNFSENLDNLMLLTSAKKRESLINALVASAVASGQDGINMDFERTVAIKALDQECGPAYVQFLRELALACHERGLTVSVDIPVPFSYNSYYQTERLGEFLDYVIVMGYDEHYAGSKEAGSVASYDFVNSGISSTLALTKPEAVIWAVPFYTRVWTVNEADEVIGTKERGSRKLAEELAEMGASYTWHEKERQQFVTYPGEKGTVKIWIEDQTSMAWKAELVRNAGMAGVAAWRLGIETSEMWSTFANTFK